MPEQPTDFVDGLTSYGGNGDVATGSGIGIHLYAANRSMEDRAFQNADGELLIVPQQGALTIVTELGRLDVAPLQVALIPARFAFQGRPRRPVARLYLRELQRDVPLARTRPNRLERSRQSARLRSSNAWYEDRDEPYEVIQKFQGGLWTTTLRSQPVRCGGLQGNVAPYRYDLTRFNTINTVSFDHPDPSIFTMLTSPSEIHGTANCDFVIFPPRWMVAEGTFRPPWFHRNVMSEYMGLIEGAYDAKEGGFAPGGASLHNQMSGHGPDQASYEKR